MNSKASAVKQAKTSNDTVSHNSTRVLFVCLGNICRSPSAQGIFEHLVRVYPEGGGYIVDSAGIADYHIGKAPDRRAISSLLKQGLDISTQRCRQITVEDFEHFDIVVGMDVRNMTSLRELCPKQYQYKLKQMTSFIAAQNLSHIPDPFHGTQEDFDDMVELLFHACHSMLGALESNGLSLTSSQMLEIA